MQPHDPTAITLIAQHRVKVSHGIGMDGRFSGVHAPDREEALFRLQHRHHAPAIQHRYGRAARRPIRPLHITTALKPPFITR